MRVAVIGSRSFLAGHVCEEMARGAGADVVRLDRPDADVTDEASLTAALGAAAADVVVNFAAISSPVGSDERSFYEINAFGQANVLKALAATGFSGVHVFVSSGYVYGPKPGACVETDAPAPVNHYGASKVLAECFCNFLGGDFTTYVVRPFNCIGVGQSERFLVPKIVDAFRRRLPTLTLGDINVERDFVDARDIARMMRALIENGSPHRVLNFCNGETVSIGEIIEIASEVSGHRLAVVSEASLHRANDLSRQIGDNARIRSVGYSRSYSIEETISWMLPTGQGRRGP